MDMDMEEIKQLFPEEERKKLDNFYHTYESNVIRMQYRRIPPRKVNYLFYGDSITAAFPLQEFFPDVSLLNRGIPGDSLDGLYMRLEDDVFPYHPDCVVMAAGINGIGESNDRMLRKTEIIADRIADSGAKVYLASILPLRHGDQWNRFRYQDKIVELNDLLRELACRKFDGFMDYHAVVRDEQGELKAEFAKTDGTHVNFDGYIAMAGLLEKTLGL